jgi:hypothetical protein
MGFDSAELGAMSVSREGGRSCVDCMVFVEEG